MSSYNSLSSNEPGFSWPLRTNSLTCPVVASFVPPELLSIHIALTAAAKYELPLCDSNLCFL